MGRVFGSSGFEAILAATFGWTHQSTRPVQPVQQTELSPAESDPGKTVDQQLRESEGFSPELNTRGNF